MADYEKLTVTELLEMDNKALVSIIVSLQRQITAITSQLNILIEQLVLSSQRTFVRKF